MMNKLSQCTIMMTLQSNDEQTYNMQNNDDVTKLLPSLAIIRVFKV